MLANFVAAISSGDALIAPARDGLNSLALANAMLLSTWESRAVSLPLASDCYQQALQQRLDASSLRQKADIDANIDMSASYR